jgi:ABC-type uncharacterized transport system involved in gliding motility auxiliary subunit
LALLGAIAIAYLFADRHAMRFDLTRDGRFRLTSETAGILAGLDRDVEALAFYKEGDDTRLAMRDLLDEYAALGPRFRYEFIDPDRSPAQAKQHGVNAYGTTVVRSGDRKATIFVAKEAQLTAAIVRVTRDAVRTVAAVTGHGERPGADVGKDGYSLLVEALDRSQIVWSELFLLRDSLSVETCDALLIAGPSRDYLPEECAAIARYLATGGALVALVDPGDLPELGRLLAAEGIGLDDDIVVDRLSQAFGSDYLVPVVSQYPPSEITRDFRLGTLYPVARSVRLLDTRPAGWEGAAFVLTGPGSWGERDTQRLLAERKASEDVGVDHPAPLALAVHTERPAGKGRARIVVFGDSDFADNAHFAQAGNGDLLQNALAWAMGDEDPVSIRPRELAAEPLVLSSRQAALFFWVPVVVVPALALCASLFVLWRR